jgi:hypothetical protein
MGHAVGSSLPALPLWPTRIAAPGFQGARGAGPMVEQYTSRSPTMPVIAWLLGVPLVVIILFMLVF